MTDPIGLTIGLEYKRVEVDFLTKKVVRETRLKYLGRHPYDNRHMFALHPAGAVYVPDDGPFLRDLQSYE